MSRAPLRPSNGTAALVLTLGILLIAGVGAVSAYGIGAASLHRIDAGRAQYTTVLPFEGQGDPTPTSTPTTTRDVPDDEDGRVFASVRGPGSIVELPFTGYALVPLALLGAALTLTGMALRRQRPRGRRLELS